MSLASVVVQGAREIAKQASDAIAEVVVNEEAPSLKQKSAPFTDNRYYGNEEEGKGPASTEADGVASTGTPQPNKRTVMTVSRSGGAVCPVPEVMLRRLHPGLRTYMTITLSH